MRDEELEIDKEAIVTRKQFVMIEMCAYCECGGPVPPHLPPLRERVDRNKMQSVNDTIGK